MLPYVCKLNYILSVATREFKKKRDNIKRYLDGQTLLVGLMDQLSANWKIKATVNFLRNKLKCKRRSIHHFSWCWANRSHVEENWYKDKSNQTLIYSLTYFQRVDSLSFVIEIVHKMHFVEMESESKRKIDANPMKVEETQNDYSRKASSNSPLRSV